MKKVLIILVFSIIAMSFHKNTAYSMENRDYTNTKYDSESVYDIDKGGIQEFKILNEIGEEVVLTIEKEKSLFKSVKSGTYNITASTSQWNAGYKLSVSNNNISSVYGGYHKAYVGSFTSARLSIDNSKQSTYYLKRRVGFLNYSVNIRAKLGTNTISISH